MKEAIKKSDILIEALPYIRKFYGKVVVIKYGGAAVAENGIEKGILEDMVFMNYAGMRPVLVHGGGPFISKMMKKAGIEPKFIGGRRVTDKRAVEVIDRSLKSINRSIVSAFKKMGARAFGMSGRENGLIKVKKMGAGDLGFVGEVTGVDTTVIKRLLHDGIIPVIYPLGIGRDNHSYNVNADDVASKVAAALKAEKFVLLTNVKGVMRDRNKPATLFKTLTHKKIHSLIRKRVIEGGMIPKAQACITAVKGGVKKAHIVDAEIPHALILEIFTDEGIGTEIVK